MTLEKLELHWRFFYAPVSLEISLAFARGASLKRRIGIRNEFCMAKEISDKFVDERELRCFYRLDEENGRLPLRYTEADQVVEGVPWTLVSKLAFRIAEHDLWVSSQEPALLSRAEGSHRWFHSDVVENIVLVSDRCPRGARMP